MKKLVLIFALILAVAYFVSINKNHLKVEYISIGTQPTKALEIASFDAAAKPKNIILIIGDGTGLNQITLSRIATGGADHRLAIDQMPFFGNSLTHSYNNIYTDSAASATSWAAGIKTKNKFLSITPDGKAIPTIPEILSNKGYISGLVATSSITHATPAAFYAHIDSRYKEKEIASQLLESPIQLSLGGGLEFFDIAKAQESNLLITDMKELDGDDFLKAKKVLGLFDEMASTDHLTSQHNYK